MFLLIFWAISIEGDMGITIVTLIEHGEGATSLRQALPARMLKDDETFGPHQR